MNAFILVNVSLRGTKLGIKITIYRTKVKLASHLEFHVHKLKNKYLLPSLSKQLKVPNFSLSCHLLALI